MLILLFDGIEINVVLVVINFGVIEHSSLFVIADCGLI